LTTRVLIIDDDEALAGMVREFLTARGLAVESEGRARTGLACLERGDFEAVILDVMLPDLDGFEVCRRIRERSNVPILMLTARGEEPDRIVGLELGADDYLPKPFNPRELLARLHAILRRGRRTASAPPAGAGPDPTDRPELDFGRLVIDPLARRAYVAGEPAELTSHQFSLLLVLAQRAGRVQTRDALMEAVRGHSLEAFDRSIDVHISRIRAAIEEDPGSPGYIQTVRGVGYVFSVPPEGRAHGGRG
jgi:DNA-binding response OmpR family regulator